MADKLSKKTSLKMEGLLERLERIVEELRNQDIDVDEGIKRFEEGVALIKQAKAKLKKAENRFEKLKAELEEE